MTSSCLSSFTKPTVGVMLPFQQASPSVEPSHPSPSSPPANTSPTSTSLSSHSSTLRATDTTVAAQGFYEGSGPKVLAGMTSSQCAQLRLKVVENPDITLEELRIWAKSEFSLVRRPLLKTIARILDSKLDPGNSPRDKSYINATKATSDIHASSTTTTGGRDAAETVLDIGLKTLSSESDPTVPSIKQRGRKLLCPELDQAVYEWVRDQRRRQIDLSVEDVLAKAFELADDIRKASPGGAALRMPKPCHGWYRAFMQRHGFGTRSVPTGSRESQAVLHDIKVKDMVREADVQAVGSESKGLRPQHGNRYDSSLNEKTMDHGASAVFNAVAHASLDLEKQEADENFRTSLSIVTAFDSTERATTAVETASVSAPKTLTGCYASMQPREDSNDVYQDIKELLQKTLYGPGSEPNHARVGAR